MAVRKPGSGEPKDEKPKTRASKRASAAEPTVAEPPLESELALEQSQAELDEMIGSDQPARESDQTAGDAADAKRPMWKAKRPSKKTPAQATESEELAANSPEEPGSADEGGAQGVGDDFSSSRAQDEVTESLGDLDNEPSEEVQEAASVQLGNTTSQKERLGFWGLIKSWFFPRAVATAEPVEIASVTLTPIELEE